LSQDCQRQDYHPRDRGARPRSGAARTAPRKAATSRTGIAPLAALPDPPLPGWAVWALRAALVAAPATLAVWYLGAELARQGRLGFPLDDPYIHLVYARNLARGHGLSFNPGELSPGATSPLWVVLLAAGSLLGAPLEWLAIILGVLAACAAAWLTFEVGRAARLPEGLAFLAALAVALAGRFTWASLSGMEACLGAAAAAGVVRLQLSNLVGTRRYVTLGLVSGLAAQVRPELALLGLVVVGTEVVSAFRGPRRSEALRALLGWGVPFAAVMLPYILFCLATTGRPLPNTYYAKSFFLATSDSVVLRDLRARYLPGLWEMMQGDSPLLAWLVIPGGLLWLFRSGLRRAPAVALWPLLFMAYSVARAPFHFNASRYTVPLMPFLALLTMPPLAWLLARLRTGRSRRLLELGACLAILLGAMQFHLFAWKTYQEQVDNIIKMQVRMGEWVGANLPPGARVASNDIGAITWYGRRYCIDVMGLASSDLVTYMFEWRRSHPAGEPDDYVPGYLERARPDYCVLFPAWFPQLTRAPWMRKMYEIDYPNSTGGGNELVVYRVVR
jgi:arabinofuranosyltransferase